MKKKSIIFVIMTIVLGLYVFFTAPNLNPIYPEGAFFWLVVVTAYTLVASIANFRLPEFAADESGKPFFSFDKKKLPKKWILIPLVTLWIVYFLVQIIFNPLFFLDSYRNQMPEPAVKQFSSEVQAIDTNQIPIVDKDLARNLADKKLGEKPALGSQVTLGEPTIQTVDGRLVWVVPLQHSGFFKWLANMDGSAGYIVVSATNLKDVEYVDTYKIKIQPDSYFMHDLSRTARFTKGWFTGITDYSFELDEEGVPYWVVSTYHNTCGFHLPEADGIILVNAQTGDAQRYSLNEVPEWVDRVQPEDFILNQINNKGEYIHGVFNFSNKEKFRASAGSNIIYNNGNCYYFTGITSVGIDESATGFMMVNMVTKEPILYRMSGATEYSAMKSAQGKVQDLGYQATFPIILNVYNEPTYFMTLKDSANLIKKYAFVNVKDYMTVGVGDTMNEAEADYKKAMQDLSDGSSFNSGSSETEEKTITGEIDRISFTIEDGETIYSFTIKETPGIIYQATLSLSSSLPLTVSGDQVTFILSVDQSSNQITTSFENLSIFTSSAPSVSSSSEPQADIAPTDDTQADPLPIESSSPQLSSSDTE